MILLLSLLLVAGILGWLYWRYRVPAQVYDLLRTPSLSELAPIGKAPDGPEPFGYKTSWFAVRRERTLTP